MSAEASSGRPSVLVVDDHDGVRALYARALERAGFTVLQAADAKAALRTLDEQPVSAMLIDNSMPGMSGVEAIELLRRDARNAALPVFLITGSEAPSDRERGLQAGATEFVPKTARLREVVDRVRSALLGEG
jgi:DNA-binding response OmpR family regulator